MFKKIMVLMSALLILLGGILSTSFNSFAEGISQNNAFYVDYPEPATSEHSGYFVVMYKVDSEYRINTFAWTINPVPLSDNGDVNEYLSEMYVQISPTSVIFSPRISQTSIFDWSMVEYTSSDYLVVHRYGDYNVLATRAKMQMMYDNIIGYMFNGNIGGLESSFNQVEVPEIHWTYSPEAETLYHYLELVLDELDFVGSDVSDILSEVEDIYNQNVSMNQKLEDMKALYREMIVEQQETNTWLEKIFNFLEEKDEKDKEAAIQQGSSSTSQGMDAIEDKGLGFANSLGTLSNSMSYNGTECAWNMPQIKLPAISGVMDEVVLLESQPIDFSQWVAVIPSNIMLVIQSVLTIGLIVYCFKELYNTIAYVLTLRKDDNS